MDRNRRDWRRIHADMLEEIAKRIQSQSDTRRLRAACKTFRNSIFLSPKPLSPRLDLEIPFALGPNPCEIARLVLIESTVYVIQPFKKFPNPDDSPNIWVVKVEMTHTDTVKFKDPLTGYSLDHMPNLPKYLNMLDYEVKELTKAYGFQVVALNEEKEKNVEFLKRKMTVYHRVAVATYDNSEIDGLITIYSMAELAVWRRGEARWTHVDLGINPETGGRYYFESIIFHNNQFYVLEYSGILLTVDHKTKKATQVSGGIPKFGRAFKYLVKSSGDLLMVVKYVFHENHELRYEGRTGEEDYPIRMRMYKLDEPNRRWEQVLNGLDDKAFFVANDCTFSISADEFPDCRRNSVYFTDGVFYEPSEIYPELYAGIYDLADDVPAPAFPKYTKIFWPPPAWVTADSGLAGSSE